MSEAHRLHLEAKMLKELSTAVDPESGKARCTATSKRTGDRCQRAPVPGGTVCKWHGGGAVQVKRKAAMRLMSLVDPAIATLAREMVSQTNSASERLRAAENVLDRAGYPRRVQVDGDTVKEQLLYRLEELRRARDAAEMTLEGEMEE